MSYDLERFAAWQSRRTGSNFQFKKSDFSISATRWRQNVVKILKCDFLKIAELENFKNLSTYVEKYEECFARVSFVI